MSTRAPRVAHFVRKNTQLRASFIRNQIAAHQKYQAAVVWRKNVSKPLDGGFADFDQEAHPALDLSQGEGWKEKVLFSGPKMLSGRQVNRVLEFLDRYGAGLCHFHYGSDCGVFFPLLRKLKMPSVVSFYGYDCSSFPRRYYGYGATFLRNRVFADATAVLAMSPDMKADLIKAGCPEEKIVVHYYGTDTGRFYMERAYPEKQSVNLLILASLVPQKGHMALLRSLERLIGSGVDNLSLRIVGTGELEQALKSYVLERNLSRHVAFAGPIKYASEEMMREYAMADIFVHPSVEASNGDKEGIPGTIIEAMAAGLPVVSTYHAGIPYVIEHEKTGLLAPEYDADALSIVIERLVRDAGLRKRLGLAGQQYACRSLELGRKEAELEQIYDTLLGFGTWVRTPLREKLRLDAE